MSYFLSFVVLLLLIGDTSGLPNESSAIRNPQSEIRNPQSREEIRFSADLTEASRIGEDADKKRSIVKTYKGNVTITHGETILHADEATYVQSDKKVLLRGHVSAADSSSGRLLHADEATYYQSDEKVVLRGHVSVEDSLSKVTSDRMTYLVPSKELAAQDHVIATYGKQTLRAERLRIRWEERTVVAEGRIEFVDEENRLILTSGRIEYDDLTKFGIATESPKVIRQEASGEGAITITADTMATYTEEERAVAIGNVHLVKERLEAFCDSAAYFQKEEKILLRIGPRALQWTGDPKKGDVRRKNELTGDSIELTLKDDNLTEVAVFGEAQATSTIIDSSGAEGPDESFLKGHTITMKLQEEKLQEMAVSGNAISRYHTSEGENREPAENYATGDRITILFDRGRIARVLIKGGVQGTYYFASE